MASLALTVQLPLRASSSGPVVRPRAKTHVSSSSSQRAVLKWGGAGVGAGASRAKQRGVFRRAATENEDGEPAGAAADVVSSGGDLARPWAASGYRGAGVSSLPEIGQAASVLTVWAGIGAVTFFACGTVGPAIADAFPGYMAWSRALWPVLGLTYIAAGAAHFSVHQGFLDMYPHKGAWGFWYLPGPPSFHVNWTGVAEIVGGVGVASALLPIDTPEWVTPTAAWGIFLLSVAVTPANTYMWTHNAPGPLPENADESMAVLPWYGHLARGGLQVLLLSIMWGIAHPVTAAAAAGGAQL